MGLETAEWPGDLNENWPTGSDTRREGDDHLRLIKKVVKNLSKDLDGNHQNESILDMTMPGGIIVITAGTAAQNPQAWLGGSWQFVGYLTTDQGTSLPTWARVIP